MQRPWSAAAQVALWFLFVPVIAVAGSGDALTRARAILARHDAKGAVAILEEALPGEPSERAALLDLLRESYATAAKQAEADGKQSEADLFRDNIQILNRKAPPGKAPESTAARPSPHTEAAATRPEPSATKTAPVRTVSLPETAESTPTPAPPSQSTIPAVTVAAADAAWIATNYQEAGKLYGALARENRLPKERRDHWAYCRSVAIVKRINAKPTTRAEWESIDAEIQKIRELSPKNWFGEYLRNRAAERTHGRRVSRSNKVVLRGSAPEEEPPGKAVGSGNSLAPKAPAAPPEPAAAPKPDNAAPATAPEASRNSGTTGNWQVRETANFRILHADPALADRIAEVAEAARDAQCKRWVGPSGRPAWSPRCDIYVYPNASVFCRMTGQPEQSPGFSTMGMNGGRIVARRVNVRADHPNLVTAVLPHEITHVVLADLFPHQQIPRWADEGMAVLSEPPTEQRLRAADLDKPLATGRLFKVDDLFVMDYPDGKYWALYYAQSVSLTRFLVEQGTPTQFIKFVQGAQRNGAEAELKRVYQIDGFADLNKRWLEYAKTRSTETTASAAETAKTPETQRQ